MMSFLQGPMPSPGSIQAQMGYGWHMHDGASGMMGADWGVWPLIQIVLWLLLLGAVVTGMILLLRARRGDTSSKDADSRSSALDQLDERYARGEIDKEDYLQRKRDICDR